MSDTIRCRSCGEEVDAVRTRKPRRVVCPICGAENDVPAEESTRHLFTERELSGLAVVRSGLLVQLMASCLGIAIACTLAGVANFAGAQWRPNPLRIPLIVATLMFSLLSTTGQGLCLRAPRAARVFDAIKTAFTFQIIALIALPASFVFAYLDEIGLDAVAGCALLSLFGSVIALFPFHLFASRLCHLLERHVAGAKGTFANVFGGLILVLGPSLVANDLRVAVAFRLVIALLGLATTALHVSLLVDLRRAIGETVPKSEPTVSP